MKLLYVLFWTLCFQLFNVELEAAIDIFTVSAAASVISGIIGCASWCKDLFLVVAKTGCWPTHIGSNAYLGEFKKCTVLA